MDRHKSQAVYSDSVDPMAAITGWSSLRVFLSIYTNTFCRELEGRAKWVDARSTAHTAILSRRVLPSVAGNDFGLSCSPNKSNGNYVWSVYRIYEHRWAYATEISRRENPMESSSSRVTQGNNKFAEVRKAKALG